MEKMDSNQYLLIHLLKALFGESLCLKFKLRWFNKYIKFFTIVSLAIALSRIIDFSKKMGNNPSESALPHQNK